MTKICLKCAKKYDDSYNFCIDCGEELHDESIANDKINSVKNEIIDSIKEDISLKFSKGVLSFTSVSVIKSHSYKTIETQEIKDKHGAGTKVLATMIAGPLGYVATTGIKQETSTQKVKIDGKYLHTKVKIGAEHIVYETYCDKIFSPNYNSSWNDVNKLVINWEDVNYIDEEYNLFLNNNEILKLPVLTNKDLVKKWFNFVLNGKSLNKKLIQKYYLSIESKIDKYYCDLINKTAKNSNKESNMKGNSDLDELERIADLYEKGLLTDEEFAAMKKRII